MTSNTEALDAKKRTCVAYLAYCSALILIAALTGYALATVHHGVLDGGQGDESHRLLIAFRLIPDLSPAWGWYLTQPWPPLPYVLQVLTHRALKLTLGITDQQFIQSAFLCSITLYSLHLLAVLEMCRRLRATIAGLFYVAASTSAAGVVALATSALAETPALFFVSLAGLFLTYEKRGVEVMGAGLMFLLASLCRSEVALFGGLMAGLLLFRYGIILCGVFALIAMSGFGYKLIYAFMQASTDMSYLNLTDFYWLGDSVSQRLGFLKSNLITEGKIDANVGYVLMVLPLALIIQLIARVASRQVQDDASRNRLRFGVAAIVFGLASTTCILALVAVGKISWVPRYFLVPASICCVGVFLVCAVDGVPGKSSLRFGRIASALTWVLTATVAGVGGYGLTGSLQRLDTLLPIELRQARDVIVKNVGPTKLLVIDALVFWEPYELVHAVIDAGATNSGCVYDHPPVNRTPGMQAALAAGESDKTVSLLGFIDQYEPAVLATAGPEWRAFLDAIPRFIDYAERATYVLPSITWQSEVEGELSLSKIGSGKRFRVTRIYENAKVRLYRLARITE